MIMKIPEFSLSFKLTPKRSIVAVAISSLLAFLTVQCGISEERLLQFYNELRRKFNPANLPDKHRVLEELDNELNRRIIQNEKLLEQRIKIDVDDAINSYLKKTHEDSVPNPITSELPIDSKVCYTDECRSLGGEMRICSPWIEGCENFILEEKTHL